MFRIMFDFLRSSICIKDLLLHINPVQDIKECKYKICKKVSFDPTGSVINWQIISTDVQLKVVLNLDIIQSSLAK